jgi:uncharacterized protein (TIGR01244 family)
MSRLIAAVLLLGPLVADPPETVEPASIPNYRLMRPDLAAAGQPSDAALQRLGEMGFRTVINIRTAEEWADVEEEGELLRSLGLNYVWVPVTAASLTLDDVREIEAVIDDPAAGPILLHCASSNRVGGVWAAIQALKGKPLEEAVEEGRAAGLRSPAMTEAVRRLFTEARR